MQKKCINKLTEQKFILMGSEKKAEIRIQKVFIEARIFNYREKKGKLICTCQKLKF